MRTKAFWGLVIALSILFPLSRVYAQADRGAIKGEVQDSTGGAMPGAQVTLKNEATGVLANTTSTASGQFGFVDLLPGVYTVTAGAKGFTTSSQQHIPVDVGRTIAVTMSLQPGQATQTVTVSANTLTVDTQTSEVGTTVSPQEIKDLPLPMIGDMRNPLSFVLLTPGVYGSTPGATPDYRLHVSGAASYSDDLYIDGIPIANPNLPGNFGNTHPPIDAVSEFKIVNNNASAHYGFSSSIVSFAFKSGTNAVHGSLFEYLQNDAFNAAGFVPDAVGQKKAPLRQNEYGGTFGGPVWIPKLYNGRDKTFFFVDYTGFKYRPSAVNATLTTIPTPWRTGDFSDVLGPQLTVNGQPVFDPEGRPVDQGQIYNPFSAHTVTGPDGKSYQVRDPFPGNIIPPGFSGLSAASQKILPYFPAAQNNSIFNNFTRLQSSKIDEDRLVVKVDEDISTKHQLSGSVFIGGYSNSNNGGLNLLDATGSTDPTTQIRFSYNYAASPTVVNNFNMGFLRDNAHNGPLNPGPGLAALGITGLPALSADSPFPLISLGTLINSIGSTAGGASAAAANRFIVNDNLTWIHGTHSITFGGDLRRLELNNAGISNGNFTFEPIESGLNGTGFINGTQAVSLPVSTGNPVSSFLFGGMDYSHFDYPIPQYYRWTEAGLYVEDDWRARPDLTLNLGLRWDVQVPRTEKYGNVSSVNPLLPNPAAGGLPGAYTFYGIGGGRNGMPRIGNIDWHGFQPRVGLAYSPGASRRTAFRAGFGVFRPIGNDNLQGGFTGGYNAGFSGLANVNRPQDYLGSPAYYWDSPYPASGISLPNSNLSPATLTGNDNSIWIAPNVGLPPAQLYWSSQIQRQIGSSMVATIGYIGMHTYHLGLWAKPNEVNPALAQQNYSSAAAAAGLPLNEFLALPITDPRVTAAGITPPFPGFVALMGPAATLSQALRPFPQYGDVDHPEDPIGSVSYNGLQTSLQKRFSQGLTFLVSYTFSKTIGDVDSNSGPFAGAENAIFAGSFFQNYYDEKSERNVTSSDIPHVLSLSYTYELPVGPGKHFVNRRGAIGKIVGSWEVSGIQQYQSGRPIHIEYDAFGSSNPYFAAGDGFSFRPDEVPGQPLKNPDYSPSCSGPVQPTPGRIPCQFYINPAAFVAPPPGQFGSAPNLFSNLRLPAFFDEDFSVSKRIPLTERVDLQFQANFFNAFNRVIFSSGGNAQTFILNAAPPDLSAASLANSPSIFGIMTAQQNGPRIIQFGLKLEF